MHKFFLNLTIALLLPAAILSSNTNHYNKEWFLVDSLIEEQEQIKAIDAVHAILDKAKADDRQAQVVHPFAAHEEVERTAKGNAHKAERLLRQQQLLDSRRQSSRHRAGAVERQVPLPFQSGFQSGRAQAHKGLHPFHTRLLRRFP